ncbi:hypothetical protein [Mucilaginibacter sp.]|uniref:hypothetical protein n=1 Tax=Mucilaginibacter sp. TaxID=1882438 RepID=UPI003D0FBB51
MKKLLLNFLFFVGAALIFLQCARLFPTPEKTLKHKAIIKKNTIAGMDKTKSPATNVFNTQNRAEGFKLNAFAPIFTNPALPYLFMLKANVHRLHHSITGLKNYNLASNYRERLQTIK